MRRRETLTFALLGLLSIVGIVWAVSTHAESSTIAERLTTIRSMTPEEQSHLLANKQRFDRLPAGEQQRLREIHEQLAAEPDANELRGVLERYDQWLAELSFTDSSSVRSLPLDQRVERIKQLRREQFQQQLKKRTRVQNLSQRDLAALGRWWTDFVRRNEQQLMKSLPANAREVLGHLPLNRRQQRLEWLALMHQNKKPSHGSPPSLPTAEDFQSLMPLLSLETRRRLERTNSDNARLAMITNWIQSDWRRRSKKSIAPYIDPRELEKFSRQQLAPEELAKLKKLPPQQQRRELAKRYIQWKMSKRRERGPDPRDNRRDQDKPLRPDHHSPRPSPPLKHRGDEAEKPKEPRASAPSIP